MEKIYDLLTGKSRWFLYTVIVLVMLPFLSLSLFNHPASDDFCYTNFIRDNDFWAAQVKHYLIWTGRFTATFMLTVDPIDLGDLTAYKILPMALLFLFGIAILIFIRSLFPNLSQKDRTILSFLIFFLYLYYIPNTAEAFYWRAGSITYQLASIFTLFLFTTIRHLQKQQFVAKRFTLTFLACLIATITIGLNETSMIIILVIIFLWTVGWFIIRKDKRMEMGIILCITMAATATVILAPGNAHRMAEKPEKFQFLFSIVGSVKIALVHILSWIPMTVLLLALFSPLINKVGFLLRARYNLNRLKLWHLGLIGIFFFCFIVLCYFPSFWSQGGRPPYRTINVIYLLFIVGTFFLSFFFFTYLQNNNSPVPQLSKGVQLFLIVVILSIVIFKPNNIREAYEDLAKGTAFRYHQEMKERYRLLKNCTRDSCIVPPLKNKPFTILSSDLSTMPNHESFYYNACIADFFGIKKVYLSDTEFP